MSDSNYKPAGTGVVMGDTAPMPDRGSDTGLTGIATDTGGMSLGADAINRLGSISDAGSDPMAQERPRDEHIASGGHDAEVGQPFTADSDPAAECYPDDPAFGPAPGDAAEDKKEGY